MVSRFYSSLLPLLGACLFIASWSQPAAAHPGHGTIDSSLPLHYLVDPLHATPWMIGLTTIVLALLAYRLLARKA